MSSYRRLDQNVSYVKHVFNYKLENSYYTGYILTLENKDTIKILIQDGKNCCEEFGTHLLSPSYNYKKERYGDTYKSHIDLRNATIYSIKWGKEIDDKYKEQAREKGICSFLDRYSDKDEQNYIVNIYTNLGLFQAILFNYHNGYYKHDIYVEWGDYKDTETL